MHVPPCLHLLEPALIVCSGMTVLPVLIMTPRDAAGDTEGERNEEEGGVAGDVSLGVSSNICCVWRGEAREGEANVHTRWVRRCGREQRDEAGGREGEHESEIESGLAPPPARPSACVRCVALARRLFCVATTLPPPKNSGWSAAEWAPNLKQRRTLAS